METIKTYCWIAVFFLLTSNTWAQSEVDSLRAVLKELPDDSKKVQVFNRLAYIHTYFQTDLKLARSYADSALQLSQLLAYHPGTYNALRSLGLVQMKEGDYVAAWRNLEEYKQFYQQRGDSSQVMLALYSIAIIHGYQGDYEKKLETQLRIVRYYEKEQKKAELARALSSLGNTYSRLKKYREAMQVNKKASVIFKELSYDFQYAMALHNMANISAYTQKHDSALLLYQQSLDIIQRLGMKEEEGYIITNLGSLYKELGQHQKSLEYHLQALDTWNTLKQPKDIAEAVYYIGGAYSGLRKFKEALPYLNRAVDLGKELGLKELTADSYQELSKLHSATNNYKLAYDFTNLSQQIRDSIFNEQNALQINELQTRYETDKKNQQIALLATEKELQTKEVQRQATLKKAFIGGGILVALVAALLLFNLRQRLLNQKQLAAKNQEIKEAHFERQLSQLEMKALQAQINPHFIFNCLNSINQMILQGEDNRASRYLTKFSKLIRLVLENAETSEVTLHEELAVLESYIELEQLRFQGDIDYQLKVDSQVDPQEIYLPSMVLQPFVENAIWHGLMPKKDQGSGKITIAAHQKGDLLVCSIEDNGVGREKAQELQDESVWKTKSLGLKITEERLNLLNQDYQEDMIQITDLKDASGIPLGTRVEVSIPT